MIERSGYAAIYEDGGGAPGRRLGQSKLLGEGRHSNVSIRLTALVGGEDPPIGAVYAVVHAEDSGNATLDFPSGDAPLVGESGVVLVKVAIEE